MGSNLTALLREIVTAIGDHADAIRDLAEAVREQRISRVSSIF